LNKAIFLVRYIFIEPQAHWFTAFVGFGTLVALLVIRGIKRIIGKRWTWVKWFPEVLMVVILSTGKVISDLYKTFFSRFVVQH
jgi:hypothetical protein